MATPGQLSTDDLIAVDQASSDDLIQADAALSQASTDDLIAADQPPRPALLGGPDAAFVQGQPKPLKQRLRESLSGLIGETQNQTLQRTGGQPVPFSGEELLQRYGPLRVFPKIATTTAMGVGALAENSTANLIRLAEGKPPLAAPDFPEQIQPQARLRDLSFASPTAPDASATEKVTGLTAHAVASLPGFIGAVHTLPTKWPEVVRMAAAGNVWARLLLRSAQAGIAGGAVAAAEGGNVKETLQAAALTAPLGPLGEIASTPARVGAMAAYGAAPGVARAALSPDVSLKDASPEIISGMAFNALLGLMSHGQRNPFAKEFALPMTEIGGDGKPIVNAKTRQPVTRTVTGTELREQFSAELTKAGLSQAEAGKVVDRLGRLLEQGLTDQAHAEFLATISKARRVRPADAATEEAAPAPPTPRQLATRTAPGEPTVPPGTTLTATPVVGVAPATFEQAVPEAANVNAGALLRTPAGQNLARRIATVRALVLRNAPNAAQEADALNEAIKQHQLQQGEIAPPIPGEEQTRRYSIEQVGQLVHLRDSQDLKPLKTVPATNPKQVARLGQEAQLYNSAQTFDDLAMSLLSDDELAHIGMASSTLGGANAPTRIGGEENAIVAGARAKALDLLGVTPEDDARITIDNDTTRGRELRAKLAGFLRQKVKEQQAAGTEETWRTAYRDALAQAQGDEAGIPEATLERLDGLANGIAPKRLDAIKAEVQQQPAASVVTDTTDEQQPAPSTEDLARQVEDLHRKLDELPAKIQQQAAAPAPPASAAAEPLSPAAAAPSPPAVPASPPVPRPPSTAPPGEIPPANSDRLAKMQAQHDALVNQAAEHDQRAQPAAAERKRKQAAMIAGQMEQLAASPVASAAAAPAVPAAPAALTTRLLTAFPWLGEILARSKILEAARYVDTHAAPAPLPAAEVARRTAAHYGAGAARKEKRIEVVIGEPGAGKSRAYVDRRAAELGAWIADNDLVRKTLPDFADGKGAGLVQDQADAVNEAALGMALANGDNIILPKLGRNLAALRTKLEQYQALGYHISLIYVGVSPETSVRRSAERYEKGKQGFIAPDWILTHVWKVDENQKYHSQPEQTYVTLRREERLDHYERWSNDTPGQPAQQLESYTRGPADVRPGGSEVRADHGRRGSEGTGTGPRPGGTGPAVAGPTTETLSHEPDQPTPPAAAPEKPDRPGPGQPGGQEPAGSAVPRPDRSTGGATGDRGGSATGEDRPDQRPVDQPDRVAPSPATPGAEAPADVGNFLVTDPELLSRGGAKTKFTNNLNALRTLRTIQLEGRSRATLAEQQALALWVGWGQFPQVFDEANPEWTKERAALRELLPTEELWKAARRSTINAHYTDPRIAIAIWQAAQRLGFTRGRVLEAGVGSGVPFLGTMPAELRDKSGLTGVELDPTSGAIARLLFPDANIQIKKFQEFQAADNFFDLNIGNYPFGSITILSDRTYSRLVPSLHDYFVLKSLDKVRPGGLIAVITSMYTLDKVEKRIRQELDRKAELVAAWRLPGGAFQKNAGTAVVTDVLFLRKWLPDEVPHNAPWLDLAPVDTADGTVAINEYFAAHPENILGTLDKQSKLYKGDSVNVSLTKDFEQRLQAAIARLPQNVMRAGTSATQENEQARVEARVFADDETKPGGLAVKDGKLYSKDPQSGDFIEKKAAAAAVATVRDALKLRNARNRLVRTELAQDADPDDVAAARAKLNEAYDYFAGKHGRLGDKRNTRLLKDDPDYPNLIALERRDPKTGLTKKADIFSKRTVRAPQTPEKATTVADAAAHSLNRTAGIDPAYIASVLNRPVADVEHELVASKVAYLDPAGGWQPAALYLTGNVRQKLLEAAEAAAADPQYQPNVTALRAVQPADLAAGDIDVRLGASWVPPNDVAAFAAQLLNASAADFDVKFVENLGTWVADYSNDGLRKLRGTPVTTTTWGTARMEFMTLLQATLSGQVAKVWDRVPGEDRSVINAEATADAAAKQEELKQAFRDWLWTDDSRRERLLRRYNDTFNNRRTSHFDGSHLTLPGADPQFTLLPHQKNFIWRVISTGRALAAHEVGTGKTFAMVSAAMELRRLGLANKPAVAVPKAVLPGFLFDARRLYPHAKILTTDGHFERAQRRQTVSQIATGDWDVVVLTHDNLDMLPMSAAVQREFIERELADLRLVIAEAIAQHGKSSRIVKQLEAAEARADERLQAALQGARDKDTNATFEETGIDFLFVDEAHYYKSLAVHTAGDRVKGIPTALSQRAANMFMRTQWLLRNNHGRGVVFATGTPIANTMAELFTMQRYLQLPELAGAGLQTFDAWKNSFGEVESTIEPKVTGEYDLVARFAKFTNLPELLQLAHEMMDVVFIDQQGVPVQRPKKEQEVIAVDSSEAQTQLMQELVDRAERLKTVKDLRVDNMLKISSDGRKGALDMRLVRPELPDHPHSKVNAAVARVLEIFREDPTRTQLIFSDLGVNETGDGGFRLYADIIDKLARGGIPRERIIDFSRLSGVAKQEAAARIHRGEALVGIGSTKKLGTGINAQQYLYAVHHLDAPWLPAEVEQRDGRIWRQGNTHPTIKIYRYITKGSFDAFLWNLLDRKSRFIKQVMLGDVNQREVIDEDTEQLSYEQIKAIATDNPAMIDFVRVQHEVKLLEQAQKRHTNDQYEARNKIAQADQTFQGTADKERRLQADIAQAQATAENPGPVKVLGHTYDDRKAAALKLQELAARKPAPGVDVGSYRGFKIQGAPSGFPGLLLVSANAEYLLNADNPLASMDAILRNLPGRLVKFREETAAHQAGLERVRANLGKPFKQADELNAKRQELAAIQGRLRGHGQPPPPAAVAETGLTYGADRATRGNAASPIQVQEFRDTYQSDPVAPPVETEITSSRASRPAAPPIRRVPGAPGTDVYRRLPGDPTAVLRTLSGERLPESIVDQITEHEAERGAPFDYFLDVGGQYAGVHLKPDGREASRIFFGPEWRRGNTGYRPTQPVPDFNLQVRENRVRPESSLPVNQIEASTLKVGDRFLSGAPASKGEVYVVTAIEGGKVKLQDGKKRTVDADDKITILGEVNAPETGKAGMRMHPADEPTPGFGEEESAAGDEGERRYRLIKSGTAEFKITDTETGEIIGPFVDRANAEAEARKLNIADTTAKAERDQPGTIRHVARAVGRAADGTSQLLPNDKSIEAVLQTIRLAEATAARLVRDWVGRPTELRYEGVKRTIGQPHEFLRGGQLGMGGADIWHLKKLYDTTSALAKARVLSTWGIRFLNDDVATALQKVPYMTPERVAQLARLVLQVPGLADKLGVPQHRQRILFKAAEAIRGFGVDGEPQFGALLNPRDMAAGWRYSPEDAAVIWRQLSPKEQRLVKQWDVRRRELARKDGIAVSLEGYMRRYREQNSFQRLLTDMSRERSPLAGMIAGFRKQRQNAPGYTEDFYRAVIGRELESELEHRRNEFVEHLETMIARPIEPMKGQTVLYGEDDRGEPRRWTYEGPDDSGTIVLRDPTNNEPLRVAAEDFPGIKVAAGQLAKGDQLRGGEITVARRWGPRAGELVAVDKTTYEYFKEYLAEENPGQRSAFANFLFGRSGTFWREGIAYWKLNQLSGNLGTAATNAIGNATFYAAMTTYDSAHALAVAATRVKSSEYGREVRQAMQQVLRDLWAPFYALTPQAVAGTPAQLFGGKESTLLGDLGLRQDRGGILGTVDELRGRAGSVARGVVQRGLDIGGGAIGGVAAGGLAGGPVGAAVGGAAGAVFGMRKLLEVGMIPFGLVENYARRVTLLTRLQGADPEFIEKLLDGRAPAWQRRQLEAAFDALRVFQIDYTADPPFMKKMGQGAIPFLRWLYGYARQVTRLIPLGKGKSAQQKLAGALTLLLLAYLIPAAIKWWLEHGQPTDHPASDRGPLAGPGPTDGRGTPTLGRGRVPDEAPARFQARGRQFVGTTAAGGEQYLRSTKYPYLNLFPMIQGAIDDAREQQLKDLPEALQTFYQEGVSAGPTLQELGWLFGYKQDFDLFKSPAEVQGDILRAFVPFHRLNEYRNELAQTRADDGTMYLLKPKGFWGNLEIGLPPELRNVRPSPPSDRIVNKITSDFVELQPKLEALKEWLGINIRTLDPVEFKMWQEAQAAADLKGSVNDAGRTKKFIVDQAMQDWGDKLGKPRTLVEALYDSQYAENRRAARAATKDIERAFVDGQISPNAAAALALALAGKDKEMQLEIVGLLARDLPMNQNVSDVRLLLRRALIQRLEAGTRKAARPPTPAELEKAGRE